MFRVQRPAAFHPRRAGPRLASGSGPEARPYLPPRRSRAARCSRRTAVSPRRSGKIGDRQRHKTRAKRFLHRPEQILGPFRFKEDQPRGVEDVRDALGVQPHRIPGGPDPEDRPGRRGSGPDRQPAAGLTAELVYPCAGKRHVGQERDRGQRRAAMAVDGSEDGQRRAWGQSSMFFFRSQRHSRLDA